MDVVKHECHEHGDHDTDYGSGYVGLIKEQNDRKNKQDHRHQSSR